jgi:hypothetical protein
MEIIEKSMKEEFDPEYRYTYIESKKLYLNAPTAHLKLSLAIFGIIMLKVDNAIIEKDILSSHVYQTIGNRGIDRKVIKLSDSSKLYHYICQFYLVVFA